MRIGKQLHNQRIKDIPKFILKQKKVTMEVVKNEKRK